MHHMRYMTGRYWVAPIPQTKGTATEDKVTGTISAAVGPPEGTSLCIWGGMQSIPAGN